MNLRFFAAATHSGSLTSSMNTSIAGLGGLLHLPKQARPRLMLSPLPTRVTRASRGLEFVVFFRKAEITE